MNDAISQLEGDVLAMVEKFGVSVVLDALLAFASGENISAVAEQVERRAIRLAADAEAAQALK